MAHWTKVSDRCPLGYLFRILIIFCRKFKLSDDGSVDLDVGRTSVGISTLPCKNLGKILNYTFGPQHDKTTKMTRAPSKDSDQPRHLIEVFAVRMKQPRVLSYQFSAQRRLWSDWMDAQADLNLRWEHMSFCWFGRATAQLQALVPGLATNGDYSYQTGQTSSLF